MTLKDFIDSKLKENKIKKLHKRLIKAPFDSSYFLELLRMANTSKLEIEIIQPGSNKIIIRNIDKQEKRDTYFDI